MSQNESAPTLFLKGKLRWLALGLALCIVPLILAWSFSSPPKLSGSPLEWKGEPEKKQAMMALDETVKLKGFKSRIHLVAKGENLWGIAKKEGTSIDSVLGLNPEMESLNTYVKMPVLVANTKGS